MEILGRHQCRLHSSLCRALQISSALALTLVTVGSPLAQPVTAPEYQVKAVLLFNFAQFVEWPDSAFADSASPVVIGVLGDAPFSNYLDETVRGETVHGRPLVIRIFSSVGQADTCHILFISDSEKKRLSQVLARLEGRPVLTVANSGDSTGSEIMIQFFDRDRKIGLRINLDSVEASQLIISSKLLKIAEVVDDDDK